MNDKAKTAKQELTTRLPPVREPADADYLSWGLTVLNLATYNRVDGGLIKGHIYRVAGRSSSGKTFLCRGVLAEAVRNPSFDGYDLIYDDVEYGALMDTEHFFGKGLMDRLVPPARSAKKGPIFSATVGDFYRRLAERLSKKKKCIWVEDSLDALKPDGSNPMTDGKAKAHSQGLREMLDLLQSTGSILILVSQAKVDMRSISLFPEDIASGGRAPEYYSTLEVWLKKIKTLRTSYKEKQYANGILVAAKIRKNRISGQDMTVFFPFHRNYGIDDLGACVDFLVSAKHWPKEGGKIIAGDLEYTGGREKLIRWVEDNGREDDLRGVVLKVWRSIEEAVAVKRKPKYQ